MTLAESNSDHLDGIAYLFGYPISHSMSPLFHNTVYRALGLKWEQQYLESTDMQQFLKLIRQPKFVGASVTMPHKLAVLEHLDELTDEGREVGACNTIFLREQDGRRKLVGTNTDVVGVREAFYQNVKNPDEVFHDRPGMVVGGGGAARSAIYALQKWMRASPIYIVNRDKSEVDAVIQECKEKGYGNGLLHVASVDQAEHCEGPGAIVSCVPDFPPVTKNEVVARKIIETMLAKPHKGAILEMAYRPIWTEIANISKFAGWHVILGTEAMIWQGFEQDRYWTGKTFAEMPVAEAQAAIALKLKEMGL